MYIHLDSEYKLLLEIYKDRFLQHADLSILRSQVLSIAEEAGQIILSHFTSRVETITKSDQSPLTLADLESNSYILNALTDLTPNVPVISEESLSIDFNQRKSWKTFWLVDPLDGTKEFIKGTGYFTVNIALISEGKPILGVIEVPYVQQVYYASNEEAFFWDRKKGIPPKQLHVRPLNHQQYTVVASRDHSGPAVQALCNKLPNATLTSIGSSLKFCLIAAGEADVYLRDGNTMEWDTAAAHAVLQAAGGDVYTLDGMILRYNKENLTNPPILSFGTDREFWFDVYES